MVGKYADFYQIVIDFFILIFHTGKKAYFYNYASSNRKYEILSMDHSNSLHPSVSLMELCPENVHELCGSDRPASSREWPE
jgi:hypothetical protein